MGGDGVMCGRGGRDVWEGVMCRRGGCDVWEGSVSRLSERT